MSEETRDIPNEMTDLAPAAESLADAIHGASVLDAFQQASVTAQRQVIDGAGALGALQRAVDVAQQQQADEAEPSVAELLSGDFSPQAARASRLARIQAQADQLNAEYAATPIAQAGMRRWDAAVAHAVAEAEAQKARRAEADAAVRLGFDPGPDVA